MLYIANKKTDQNTSFIVEHTICQTNKNNCRFFSFLENAKIYLHIMWKKTVYSDFSLTVCMYTPYDKKKWLNLNDMTPPRLVFYFC